MWKKIAIILIVSVLVFTSCWYGYQGYLRYQYIKESVIVGEGALSCAIYIEPDDSATRAAANYLAYSIEQALGEELPIVTTKDGNDWRYISIVCKEDYTEPEQQASIEFITVAEASGAASDSSYSIHFESSEISIIIPERENCFGAVKAISDRWLKKDCGLKTGNQLVISHAMADLQLSGLVTEYDGQIRILTQNLRYCDDEGGNTIDERAVRFAQLVEHYRPDLIGVQECTAYWLEQLREYFSADYELYGTPSNGADGWYNAILYRRGRFEFLDGKTFWLSNTPDTPATKLNYNGINRICSWVLLRDTETGKTFLYSNTHLQNGGKQEIKEVRDRQVEILFRQLRKGKNYLEGYPGFLTGDFNGQPVDEPFYARAVQVYEDSQPTAITNSSDINYSYHSYGTKQYLLDYCFHSPKNVTILDYRILDDDYGGYVSDHYGILVSAVLN